MQKLLTAFELLIMFLCEICEKSYALKASLVSHFKTYHREHYDTFRQKIDNEKKGNFKFNCDCGRNYNSKANYNKHLKTHQEITLAKKYECPLCNTEKTSKPEIIKHFNNDHNINIVEFEKTFGTFQEFNEWKTTYEGEEHCFFSKLYGDEKLNGIFLVQTQLFC